MFKKLLAGILTCALTAGSVPSLSALAQDANDYPDLRVYYSFDSDSSVIADKSGNGRDAKLYGTAEFSDDTAEPGGKSLLLKGGYVHMPEDIFGDSESLTISVWTRPMRSAAWSRIWDIGNGTNQYLALMSPSSDTRFACEIKNGSTDNDKARATSSQSFTTGSWKNVVVTYSQNGNITLYENGVQTGQTAVGSLKTADFGNITRAFIGRSMFSPDTDYYGYVDEFKIYGGSLSAAQIKSLYSETAVKILSRTADELDLAAFNSLSDLSAVQQDLSLPAKSNIRSSGASISWKSSDESVITSKGKLGSKTGAATLTATLTLSDFSATADFEITTITPTDLSADSIAEITTEVGKKPSLPKKISANGGKATLTVTWDNVDPTQYAYAGTSEISGTASNGQKVTATIKTVDDMANLLIQNGAPDPYITYHDGYYYSVRSDSGITVAKSKRLQDIGTAPRITVWTAPSTGMYSREIWATEMHFIDDNWYIYFAADDGNNANHRMYCIKSTDPDNAQAWYEMAGKLAPTEYNSASGEWDVISSQDKWAIDGTVLQDVNGKDYFIWSGWEGYTDGRQNIYIAEMLNPWTLKGERVLLSAPDTTWEQKGQTGVLVNEGPQVVKHGNKVHILYSANGSWTDWYCIGALTANISSDLLDTASWQKSSGPLFTQSFDPADCTYGVGHACVTTSPDGSEYYFVYHAFYSAGGGWEDRSARIIKFDFDENDFPILGNPKSESSYLAQPSGTESAVSVKYEAETAKLENAKTASQAQRSGGKYVTGVGKQSTVTFNAKVPVSGIYQVNIMGSCPSAPGGNCYVDFSANGDAPVKLRFRVNGDGRKTTPAHLASSNIREGFSVKLAAGVNKITLKGSSDTAGSADVDFMQLLLTEQTDVKSAQSVAISESDVSLKIGESKSLTATVSPADAANTEVIWSSDNDSVATVDQNGNIKAVGVGSAVITAASYNNPDIIANCNVTVNPIPADKITLDKPSLTITVGGTANVTATVSPDDATDKSLIFSSSDDSVATVDQSGKITAIKAGKAVITVKSASNPEVTASCTVTVTAPKPTPTPSVPKNGIKVVNGKTVLYKNSKAVTGTKVVTVSGKTYAVVKGYVKTGKGNRLVNIGKKTYIVNKNGIVQKGAKNKLIKVGKKSYIVNKQGIVQKNKKSVKVGKKTYKTNKKGVAVLKKQPAKKGA